MSRVSKLTFTACNKSPSLHERNLRWVSCFFSAMQSAICSSDVNLSRVIHFLILMPYFQKIPNNLVPGLIGLVYWSPATVCAAMSNVANYCSSSARRNPKRLKRFSNWMVRPLYHRCPYKLQQSLKIFFTSSICSDPKTCSYLPDF